MQTHTILRKYICIIAGMGILAYGIYNIHSRCLISEGGILGLILLIQRWLNILPGYTSLFLDSCCFLAGHFLLQDGFLRDSVLSSILFSFWYTVLGYIGPTFPNLSSYPLAASLVGALFVGVGIGMVMMYGVAAGGDDCLSLIFHQYTHLPVSIFYNISDATVLLLSLTYIPVQRIMYSLLSVVVSAWIIAAFQHFGESHHFYVPRKAE